MRIKKCAKLKLLCHFSRLKNSTASKANAVEPLTRIASGEETLDNIGCGLDAGPEEDAAICN